MNNSSKLYTVVSRFGTAGNPDDVEAILQDGAIAWPTTGYVLSKVVYFTSYDEAAQIAIALGAHRAGALVSVQPHARSADYIANHRSPVLDCGAPIAYALAWACNVLEEAEGLGYQGGDHGCLSAAGWRASGPMLPETADHLIADGLAAGAWIDERVRQDRATEARFARQQEIAELLPEANIDWTEAGQARVLVETPSNAYGTRVIVRDRLDALALINVTRGTFPGLYMGRAVTRLADAPAPVNAGELAAAARDDEAFNAQDRAGLAYNPETDYRLASDLEIVDADGALDDVNPGIR